METILSLKNVSKFFGSSQHARREVVKSISFNLKRKESIAIIGKSGSGKSTILNMIAGLEKPDEGIIDIEGQNINTLTSDSISDIRLKKIGYVFQFFNLLPTLSLSENIKVPGFILGLSKAEIDKRALKYIDRVGLSKNTVSRLPHEISGGESQRGAIARALFCNPTILLADEPTGNLDSESAEKILEIFKEIPNEFNTSLIVVTHDDDTKNIANRVLTLEDGKIVE